MWVRGLKPIVRRAKSANSASHPMWVRGLKPQVDESAPVQFVAPYVGAWIETDDKKHQRRNFPSHPMWVRGLKHVTEVHGIDDSLSHPMWVRGLKHDWRVALSYNGVSHPMWMRELKHHHIRIKYSTVLIVPSWN